MEDTPETENISSGVSSKNDSRPPYSSRHHGNFALLSGVAAHDLYHAGQIQLLKRLYQDSGR